MEFSAFPVISCKGHSVMTDLSQGLCKAPRLRHSDGLRVCSAVLPSTTQGPFSSSSVLGEQRGIQRGSPAGSWWFGCSSSPATKETLSAGRPGSSSKCTTSFVLTWALRPPPPQTPRQSGHCPSWPSSSERNARIRLDAFLGAAINFRFTCPL